MSSVSKHLCGCAAIAGLPLVLVACGRTPMLPPTCDITIAPTTAAFDPVPPGEAATREIHLGNRGGGQCTVTNIGTSPTSDPWFSVSGPAILLVESGEEAVVAVTFRPLHASIPLSHTGELTFDVDSGSLRHAAIPLTATVLSNCKLAISPTAVDFGHVAIDTSSDRLVRLANSGTGSCDVGKIALGPSTDAQFRLGATPDAFTLAPGEERSLTVTFSPTDPAPPHHRTGSLVFASNDTSQAKVTIPLSADIDIGCNLSWTPASIDFGSIRLNTKADRRVTLANDGSDTCYLSGIGFTQDSHPDFRLISTETTLAVLPGATPTIGVRFTAGDSSTPHHKTGTLIFQTGNKRQPTGRVPLSADVDTVCVDASRWIYTLDDSSGLARFDPATLTFTDIATLRCPTSSEPNSMAVDQNAVAWVGFQDGSLFKVDVSTGVCEATSFKPRQYNLANFGMGFVFDPSTGKDTLYIAGEEELVRQPATLAAVSFPSLTVTRMGTVDAGSPELTGTGDGQLWGFIPQDYSMSYRTVLVRLDPSSGATLKSYEYRSLTSGRAWAVKFWGGYFWVFLDTSVYKISRDRPEVVETAIEDTRRDPILGAGVSTCAPVE